MRIIFIVIFGSISLSLIAQDKLYGVPKRFTKEEWIKIQTTKNVLVTYLAFHKDGVKSINKNRNKLYPKRTFFWDTFFPDPGEELDCEIRRVDLNYPENKYDLFEVKFLPVFSYSENDSGTRYSIQPKIPADHLHNLVGIGKDDRIVFFSGGFIHSTLWQKDFRLDNDSAIINYIRISNYRELPKNLTILKKTKSKCYIKYYSRIFDKEYFALLKMKNQEAKSFETISSIENLPRKYRSKKYMKNSMDK